MAQFRWYNAPTNMVQAQLCYEWHKLRYWSPVQIFCYHQINYLRQNLYMAVKTVSINYETKAFDQSFIHGNGLDCNMAVDVYA